MTTALAEKVIAIARDQLGKPYLLGAEGPDEFDCSGLVFYCFTQAGAVARVGGGRHRARWYYRFFASAGRIVDESHAKRGDLVFYGHSADNVTHVGLYLGPKRRRAISALINPWGVSRHVVDKITVPVVGFGSVDYAALTGGNS